MLHFVKDAVAGTEGVRKIFRNFSSIKDREMKEKRSEGAGVGGTDRHYLFVIGKENILGLSRLPDSTLLILLVKADSGQAKFLGGEGSKVVAHCFHYEADGKKN